MVLNFAGKQYEEKVPEEITSSERNDLLAMIQKRADADILMEDVRWMDEELAHLDRTTGDPSLKDHPARDVAVAKLIRISGQRLLWLDRIHYIVDDVVNRWYRMSDKARGESDEYWGISRMSEHPSRDCWAYGLRYHPPLRRGKSGVRAVKVKEKAWRS